MKVPYNSGESGGLSISAGATRYMTFLTNAAVNVNTSDTGYVRTIKFSGVVTNLIFKISSNVSGNDSTITLRKNSADATNTLSINSGSGTFEDVTHSDYYLVGDTIGVKLVGGTGSGSMLVEAMGALFNSDSALYTISNNSVTSGTFAGASTTYYFQTNGLAGTAPTTEGAGIKTKVRNSCIRKNLSVYISTARATNSTYRSRVNGANGNLTVTITGGVTGLYEDTTNSDVLVSGDLINNAVTTGTGSDNLIQTLCSTSFISTDNTLQPTVYLPTSTTWASGLTRYFCIAGRDRSNATESNGNLKAGVALTLSKYQVYLSANSINTGNIVFTIRKNSADGNGSITIAAGAAAGWYEDTSNSDTFLASDDVGWKMVTGGSSGTITLDQASMLMTLTAFTRSNFFLFM